jgi:hypothetical protein
MLLRLQSDGAAAVLRHQHAEGEHTELLPFLNCCWGSPVLHVMLLLLLCVLPVALLLLWY